MSGTDSAPRQLWTLVARSLRPTYGARANAAEGLAEVRRVAREHAAQAGAAPQVPRPRHEDQL